MKEIPLWKNKNELSDKVLGYYFAKQQEPVEIGFATVKDMSFLVQELQECKEALSYETN